MSDEDLSGPVPEDTTLSAFQSTGGSETEPAKAVFVWRPDGVSCEECGTVVSGRWRDGESWYCTSCVTWNRS